MPDQKYIEGSKDYFRKKGVYRNPYPIGSNEYNHYEQGWVQAQKKYPSLSIQAMRNENTSTRLRKEEERKNNARRRIEYLKAKGDLD